MALIGEVAVAITGDTSALQAATRKGSEEMRQFARDAMQAKRIVESLETPTETYARKLQELQRLVKSGALSMEDYNRAQKKLREELEETEERLAGVVDEVESQEDAFKAAAGQAVAYATAMVGVGEAVGIVKDALALLRQEGEAGANSIQGLSGARADLAQVATSGQDLRALEANADRLATRFGISREEAARLVFSGRSEGFLDAAVDIAAAGQLVGVDAAATAGGQFRNLFAREGLTSQQAISATLRAAGGSRARFAEIAAAAPVAAETAGSAGTGAAETLALLSVLSGEFASPKTAADRIKSFNALVGQEEALKGRGVLGAFDVLKALSDEDRKKILGESQERNAVYEKLLELAPRVREEARRNQADINLTERGLGALSVQRGIQESSTRFQADRAARQAEIEREISQEQLGFAALQRQRSANQAAAARNEGLARGDARATAEFFGEAVANKLGVQPGDQGAFFGGAIADRNADAVRANRGLAASRSERADRTREANEAAMIEELRRIGNNTEASADNENEIQSFR